MRKLARILQPLIAAPGQTWCSTEGSLLGMIFDVEQPQEGRREPRRKRRTDCFGRRVKADRRRGATTGTPGEDLRAAERTAIGGAGRESTGDSEGSGGLRADANGAARVRRFSLLGRSLKRGDAPSEEAGEPRSESGKPWRGKQTHGSIDWAVGSNAAAQNGLVSGATP